jgi:hypothetical protein
MRWMGHVARMGDTRNAYGAFNSKILERRDDLIHLGADEMIILKLILNK